MNYFYEAVDPSGRTVVGKLDGANELEVRNRLLSHGFQPVSIAANAASSPTPNVAGRLDAATGNRTGIPMSAGNRSMSNVVVAPRPSALARSTQSATTASTSGAMLTGNAARRAAQRKPAAGAASPKQGNASTLGGVSTRDQMFFFQQFATLVKSGITLYSALGDLAKRTQNKNLAQTAQEMSETARSGGRISDVMEKYPRIYPDHVVGTVRAGELGGFLEIALSEIALNYEQNIALYRGSWIPKAMAIQSFFLLPFVQPLYPTLFPQMDIKQYLILAFLRNLPIFLAVFFLIRLGAARLQLPQYRYLRDSWSLRLPPFGDLQRQVAIAAFIRMLRRLYHAGVSPILAWEGAMNTASNVVIRDKLASAYGLMQQGASLPDAFAATGLFANSIEQTIATGHQAGEVVEALDRAATYYQDRVGESVGRARFMMFRYGLLALLIFGGAAMCWMEFSYYKGIFKFVDDYFKVDG